jgi:hypothetical protein
MLRGNSLPEPSANAPLTMLRFDHIRWNNSSNSGIDRDKFTN